MSDSPTPRLCCECGGPVPSDIRFSICPDCSEARAAHAKKEAKDAEHERRVQKWLGLCPPLYRSTDWQRQDLSPVCAEVAGSWWAGRDGIGLGLYGSSGKGKTRAMFAVLQRHHFAGRHVLAIQSMDIEEACAQLWNSDAITRSEAQRTLAKARTAGILYIDDLGKEKMSESVAKEFHRLIEHRCRHRLPTLWTSEQSGEWLAQRMGQAYGDGLTRRLREFTDIRPV